MNGYLTEHEEKFIHELGRIADALESIDDKLEQLADCVDYVPPNSYQVAGYNFFRIDGRVETD